MKQLKRLFEGVVVLSVISVFAAVVSYFTRLFLARTLSLEDFGLYFSIFSFMSFFLMFRDLGLGVALTRSIAKFRTKKRNGDIASSIFSSLLIQFIISTIIILILFFIAKPLSIYFFKKPEADLIIKLFLFYIYFSIIAITIKSVFLGFQKNAEYSFSELVKNMGALLTIVVCSYFITNSFLPLIGYTFGWVFLILFLFPSALKTFNVLHHKLINLKFHVKKLFFFGLPLLFSDIGSKIIGNTDTLMLTYFTNLEMVGIYNVVLPSALMVMFVTNGISTLILPVASELWVKNQKQKIERLVREIYGVWLLLFLPLFTLLIIYSENFLLLFFGEKFLPGTLPLQIIFAGTFFLFAADINNRLMISFGRPKFVFNIALVGGVMNVILNYFLIAKLNMVGAAIATSICYFFIFFISFLHIKKTLDFKLLTRKKLKAVLIVALVFLVNYFPSRIDGVSILEIAVIGLINLAILILFNMNYVSIIAKNYFRREE